MEKIIDNKKLIIKSATMNSCLELFSYVARKSATIDLKIEDVLKNINENIFKIIFTCLSEKECFDLILKISSIGRGRTSSRP